MTTVTKSAAKTVGDYTEPFRAAVDQNMRDVRRTVVAARHAVEDCAAEATLQVRRHPFVSLGIAAGVGSVFGCLIGLTIGRFGGRRL